MSVFSSNVALLIIDMTDDFASKGGIMYVPGAEEIAPAIGQISEEARNSKSPVIYICDSQEVSDAKSEIWPRRTEDRATTEDRIIPQLSPKPGDFVISKRRHSSFFDADLDLLLYELGVTKLVIVGITVDVSVYLAAGNAFKKGYKIAVPKRCIVAVSESEQEEVLNQMQELFQAEVI